MAVTCAKVVITDIEVEFAGEMIFLATICSNNLSVRFTTISNTFLITDARISRMPPCFLLKTRKICLTTVQSCAPTSLMNIAHLGPWLISLPFAVRYLAYRPSRAQWTGNCGYLGIFLRDLVIIAK